MLSRAPGKKILSNTRPSVKVRTPPPQLFEKTTPFYIKIASKKYDFRQSEGHKVLNIALHVPIHVWLKKVNVRTDQNNSHITNLNRI